MFPDIFFHCGSADVPAGDEVADRDVELHNVDEGPALVEEASTFLVINGPSPTQQAWSSQNLVSHTLVGGRRAVLEELFKSDTKELRDYATGVSVLG